MFADIGRSRPETIQTLIVGKDITGVGAFA